MSKLGQRRETRMADINATRLESLEIGAAPLVQAFIDRLGLYELLAASLPRRRRGRPPELPPARALCVMVSNVLLSRLALYAVPQWLGGYVPEHFGLTPSQRQLFNDDRIGRNLDLLFEAEHASLATAAILQAVETFDIDLCELHNDSTTVTFSGKYANQAEGGPAPLITFGHNKDHRPDLKQLVYSLSISADGAVPIHFRIYDGNVTDDQTHIDTWTTLCQLVGSTDFLYVADSKLCVSATMKHIDVRKGTFLTLLPATRSEEGWFKEKYLPEHLIDWQEVRRDRGRRRKGEPDNVYCGFESPQGSKEGYRILWYKSSVKLEEDQSKRFARIAAARMEIEALQCRRGRHAFKSLQAAQESAEEVLQRFDVGRYLRVRAVYRQFDQFQQTGPGRPGPNTRYERVPLKFILFEIDEDHEAIRQDAFADGLFPLITNSRSLSLAEALEKYKYQPFLEKRNEQLKNALQVAPVFLKKPERIASLLCIDFFALLVYALIERELRRQMKCRKIKSLPLYPEERLCKAPTADLVFAAFAGLRRHRLLDSAGDVLKTFYDPLPPAARTILELLDIDSAIYGIGN